MVIGREHQEKVPLFPVTSILFLGSPTGVSCRAAPSELPPLGGLWGRGQGCAPGLGQASHQNGGGPTYCK